MNYSISSEEISKELNNEINNPRSFTAIRRRINTEKLKVLNKNSKAGTISNQLLCILMIVTAIMGTRIVLST